MDEEFWPHITPLMLNKGQRIEIELGQPLDDGASDASSRPRFQVLAIDGQALQGAVRDTVLVSPGGRVRIAFGAEPAPLGVPLSQPVSYGDRDDD
jgi:FtsP/CotA-like multicopper oxidase with cupredoxin domain